MTSAAYSMAWSESLPSRGYDYQGRVQISLVGLVHGMQVPEDLSSGDILNITQHPTEFPLPSHGPVSVVLISQDPGRMGWEDRMAADASCDSACHNDILMKWFAGTLPEMRWPRSTRLRFRCADSVAVMW